VRQFLSKYNPLIEDLRALGSGVVDRRQSELLPHTILTLDSLRSFLAAIAVSNTVNHHAAKLGTDPSRTRFAKPSYHQKFRCADSFSLKTRERISSASRMQIGDERFSSLRVCTHFESATKTEQSIDLKEVLKFNGYQPQIGRNMTTTLLSFVLPGFISPKAKTTLEVMPMLMISLFKNFAWRPI
jgi:hypothetical protein